MARGTIRQIALIVCGLGIAWTPFNWQGQALAKIGSSGKSSYRASRSHTTTSHTGTQCNRVRLTSRTRRVGTSRAGRLQSRVTAYGRHQIRYRGRRHHVVAHVRYAYPVNFFLWHPPEFDQSPLSIALAQKVRYNFLSGTAGDVMADTLVRAGVATYHPLKGGVFWRREPIKYIIMHSTEAGSVMDAERIIDSWGSMGRRHAGAHYVVDREGHIFQAVDPDLATVHVNIFKTLPGINNDNAIGIEMVHTGAQSYTAEQKASVIRLVSYLQDHFQVADGNVITHKYAQQGDHTDPVNFDWSAFLATKAEFRKQALATKMTEIAEEAKTWWASDANASTVYLQPNGFIPVSDKPQTCQPVKSQRAKVVPIIDTTQGDTAYDTTAIPPPACSPAINNNMPELRGPIEMDPQDATVLSHPTAESHR
jgi:hypothetical protein